MPTSTTDAQVVTLVTDKELKSVLDKLQRGETLTPHEAEIYFPRRRHPPAPLPQNWYARSS